MGKQATLFDVSGPSASALLSAFVKCIRLRRPREAALWLGILWRSGSRNRERVQRRLLVSAAEDCINITVMQQVSAWYNSAARFDLKSAIKQTLQICQTPNWYETERGRAYIQRWWDVENQQNPYRSKTPDCLLGIIEHAVRKKQATLAMHAFNAFYGHRNSNRLALAQLLSQLALETDNRSALELVEVFQDNVNTLWNDGNFSGQALIVLIDGPIGDSTAPEVQECIVVALTQLALSPQVDKPDVPTWCLDGIHCSGSDPRFAGTVRQLQAICKAYEHYKRLDPRDVWLPEFYGDGAEVSEDTCDESNR